MPRFARLAANAREVVEVVECIETIAGKRQLARLPGFVVTYAAFLHVTLAGLGINDSHTAQDRLRSRPVQESDGLSTLQARPSENLRACHPPPAATRPRASTS